MTPALTRSLASCGLDFVPVFPGLPIFAAPATARRIAKTMRVRAETRKRLERRGVMTVRKAP